MQLNTSKFKDMVEIKSNSAWNDVQSLIKEVDIHRRIGEHNLSLPKFRTIWQQTTTWKANKVILGSK